MTNTDAVLVVPIVLACLCVNTLVLELAAVCVAQQLWLGAWLAKNRESSPTRAQPISGFVLLLGDHPANTSPTAPQTKGSRAPATSRHSTARDRPAGAFRPAASPRCLASLLALFSPSTRYALPGCCPTASLASTLSSSINRLQRHIAESFWTLLDTARLYRREMLEPQR